MKTTLQLSNIRNVNEAYLARTGYGKWRGNPDDAVQAGALRRLFSLSGFDGEQHLRRKFGGEYKATSGCSSKGAVKAFINDMHNAFDSIYKIKGLQENALDALINKRLFDNKQDGEMVNMNEITVDKCRKVVEEALGKLEITVNMSPKDAHAREEVAETFSQILSFKRTKNDLEGEFHITEYNTHDHECADLAKEAEDMEATCERIVDYEKMVEPLIKRFNASPALLNDKDLSNDDFMKSLTEEEKTVVEKVRNHEKCRLEKESNKFSNSSDKKEAADARLKETRRGVKNLDNSSDMEMARSVPERIFKSKKSLVSRIVTYANDFVSSTNNVIRISNERTFAINRCGGKDSPLGKLLPQAGRYDLLVHGNGAMNDVVRHYIRSFSLEDYVIANNEKLARDLGLAGNGGGTVNNRGTEEVGLKTSGPKPVKSALNTKVKKAEIDAWVEVLKSGNELSDEAIERLKSANNLSEKQITRLTHAGLKIALKPAAKPRTVLFSDGTKVGSGAKVAGGTMVNSGTEGKGNIAAKPRGIADFPNVNAGTPDEATRNQIAESLLARVAEKLEFSMRRSVSKIAGKSFGGSDGRKEHKELMDKTSSHIRQLIHDTIKKSGIGNRKILEAPSKPGIIDLNELFETNKHLRRNEVLRAPNLEVLGEIADIAYQKGFVVGRKDGAHGDIAGLDDALVNKILADNEISIESLVSEFKASASFKAVEDFAAKHNGKPKDGVVKEINI